MISQGAVLDIARDAIYTILITSAPLLRFPWLAVVVPPPQQAVLLPRPDRTEEGRGGQGEPPAH